MSEPVALKEPSDCKEAMPLRDVWRSATTMSGGQYAITTSIPGITQMLESSAWSWGYQVQVSLRMNGW